MVASLDWAVLLDHWLIDLATGSGQGCYDSFTEALQAVANEGQVSTTLERDGLAIVVFHRDGRLEHLGHGQALLDQAREQFPLIGCSLSVLS